MDNNNNGYFTNGISTTQEPVVNNGNVDSGISLDMIICDRCGSQMKKNARYCMKCGNLNYNHPDNVSMKKYAKKNQKYGHFVNGVYTPNYDLSFRYGPLKMCFITNAIIYGLFWFISFISFFIIFDNLLVGLFMFILFVLMFLYSFSIQCIYIKDGEPWWAYFVPFYSLYVYFKVSIDSGWSFLLLLIPGINVIVELVSLFKLGKKFSHSGILTMFFPFIMIPVIAFSKTRESKNQSVVIDTSVDRRGRTKLERNYRMKKTIFTIVALIILVVVLFVFWDNIVELVKMFFDFFMEQLEFFK